MTAAHPTVPLSNVSALTTTIYLCKLYICTYYNLLPCFKYYVVRTLVSVRKSFEEIFILKSCSWGRNHFIHPWFKVLSSKLSSFREIIDQISSPSRVCYDNWLWTLYEPKMQKIGNGVLKWAVGHPWGRLRITPCFLFSFPVMSITRLLNIHFPSDNYLGAKDFRKGFDFCWFLALFLAFQYKRFFFSGGGGWRWINTSFLIWRTLIHPIFSWFCSPHRHWKIDPFYPELYPKYF